jgi:hypothetical protein
LGSGRKYKTETGNHCCGEDKAGDFEATDDFHDESFSVFSIKGRTAKLAKSNARLRI